jgi:Leucine-rich repeat (LRR) protein
MDWENFLLIASPFLFIIICGCLCWDWPSVNEANQQVALTRALLTTLVQPDLLAKDTRLSLSNRKIISVSPETFVGLGHLRELYLNQNRIGGGGEQPLDPSLFTDLVQLTDLKLEYNRLTSLHAATFWPLVSLRQLCLQRNALTGELDAALFSRLLNLEELWLSGNQLKSVHVDTFANLAKLQILWLDGNGLVGELDARLFRDLVDLRSLRLNENRLVTVHPLTFKSQGRLEALYLQDNQLHVGAAVTTLPLQLGPFDGLNAKCDIQF